MYTAIGPWNLGLNWLVSGSAKGKRSNLMQYMFESIQSGSEMFTYVEVYDDIWQVFPIQNFLAQVTGWHKKSSYVESYDYVEVYDGTWSIIVFSCVDCDRLFLYNISDSVYRTAWIFFICLIIRVSAKGPPKKLNSATFGTKISWPKMMLVFFLRIKIYALRPAILICSSKNIIWIS